MIAEPAALKREDGVALILALLLMSVMSVMAVSLMFLSRTEAYAGMNYRMMSQARYAAEAGIQRAAAHLLDPTQYAPPTVGGADPVSAYTRTVSPVTYNGNPVILSASAAQAANYPISAKQTAFNTAVHGTLTAGQQTLTYEAFATLMSMQVFDNYAGGVSVIQTWQITSIGGLTGSRPATVEVSAIIETPMVAASQYAAFATSNQCAALDLGGHVSTDSYDSRYGTYNATKTPDAGGDVGTNGNLTTNGSVNVGGTLYTPVQGVGACTNGATGATEGYTGPTDAVNGIVQRPAINFPTPTFTVSPPTNTVTIDATLLANAATACSSLGLVSGTNCTVDAVAKTLTVDGHGTAVTMPSVSVASGFTLVLNGNNPQNVININSLTGSGNVDVAANMVSPSQNQTVALKIAGKNPDGTEMALPLDLSTMTWKQNAPAANQDATAFQIIYGGHATLAMQGGNSQSAATVYAPNAAFSLQGTQDWFGSILAKTVAANGTPAIHYDRALLNAYFITGNPVIGTFSWRRF